LSCQQDYATFLKKVLTSGTKNNIIVPEVLNSFLAPVLKGENNHGES
jgi:hypothetical protein